jgi:hypothetical protein
VLEHFAGREKLDGAGFDRQLLGVRLNEVLSAAATGESQRFEEEIEADVRLFGPESGGERPRRAADVDDDAFAIDMERGAELVHSRIKPVHERLEVDEARRAPLDRQWSGRPERSPKAVRVSIGDEQNDDLVPNRVPEPTPRAGDVAFALSLLWDEAFALTAGRTVEDGEQGVGVQDGVRTCASRIRRRSSTGVWRVA